MYKIRYIIYYCIFIIIGLHKSTLYAQDKDTLTNEFYLTDSTLDLGEVKEFLFNKGWLPNVNKHLNIIKDLPNSIAKLQIPKVMAKKSLHTTASLSYFYSYRMSPLSIESGNHYSNLSINTGIEQDLRTK